MHPYRKCLSLELYQAKIAHFFSFFLFFPQTMAKEKCIIGPVVGKIPSGGILFQN